MARKAKRKSSAKPGRRKAPVRRQRTGAAGLGAVEATLAALAHDIRTPLTGILALSDLLATSDLGERERGWALALKNTAEHLAMITSLIVDAARLASKGLVLRREPIDLHRLAEEVAASLTARAAAKDLKAELSIAPDLPQAVIGDALRLRAALENLIDNAVKFTDRGTVGFDVSSKLAGRGRVKLRFAVSDSGIGLSAPEIRRLFRPFAQANEQIARRYGGAGLGLAFVKRIAKALGGDLTVASTRNRGSRFELTVTVEDASGVPGLLLRGGGAAGVRAAAGKPRTILCAEDNPYGRVVLNAVLAELGHRVAFVGSGKGAVEAVARGGYDVVLMDVTLPEMDGIEATRRIRALPGDLSRIRIVGISGRSSADEQARAREAGMDDYLAKPVSPRALAQALAA